MKLYDVYKPNKGRISKDCHTEQWLDTNDVQQHEALGYVVIPKDHEKSKTISIYQIDTYRDRDRLCFTNYRSLESIQKSSKINSSIYDKVFEGTVDCVNLEEIYTKFNVDHPKEYRGRSLSVSDIVSIHDASSHTTKHYYCDSIGFKEVEFNAENTCDISSNRRETETMKIVVLEPDKEAEVRVIQNDLDEISNIVGGYVGYCYPFSNPDIVMLFDDDAKLKGDWQFNRSLKTPDGTPFDLLAGTVVICGTVHLRSGAAYGSLTQTQIHEVMEQYEFPEYLVKQNEQYICIPHRENEPISGFSMLSKSEQSEVKDLAEQVFFVPNFETDQEQIFE